MRDFGNEIWKREPIQEIGKGEKGNNMGTESGTIKERSRKFSNLEKKNWGTYEGKGLN